MNETDKVVRANPSKSKPLPTREFLEECFEVNFETGKLFWKKRPLYHFKNAHGMRIHHAKWSGKEAGSIFKSTDGAYRRAVTILGQSKLLTSRIIFFMSGEPDPGSLQVDHIDGDALNNRRGNLRVATNQMNNANIGRKTYLGRVRHLPKGVYPNGVGKWQAKIKVNYKTYCLGTYRSPEEASVAYGKAAEHHFGQFARRD